MNSNCHKRALFLKATTDNPSLHTSFDAITFRSSAEGTEPTEVLGKHTPSRIQLAIDPSASSGTPLNPGKDTLKCWGVGKNLSPGADCQIEVLENYPQNGGGHIVRFGLKLKSSF